MKKILSFIQKEFYHIIRDKRTLLIMIGIPMVMILLFGFAITTDVKNVKFAVEATNYNSDVSRLVQRIDASEYFIFVGKCDNDTEADEALRLGRADIVISFDKDFVMGGRNGNIPTLQLCVNACDPSMATSESAILEGVINSYFQEQMGNSMPSLNISTRLLYNPRLESSYNFVPGIMGMILLLFCAMMTSVSIVREKEMGTMEVLLVSPTKPLLVILAKMVPYFVVSLVNLASILLMSYYILGIPVQGSLLLLIGVTVVYMLLALAIGMFISTVMDTQIGAIIMSVMLLLMPTFLLSGLMYPIDNFPKILQYLSVIFPARWYISAIRKIMIQGVDLQYVLQELGILTGMFLLVLSVSLKKYSKRLE